MNYLKIILSLLALSLSQNVHGATILYYDSNSVNTHDVDLERIASQTDAAFVASSDATTSVGSGVTALGAPNSQTNTVTLGTGNDLMFRFGTGAYSDDLPTALADGKWLGMSFVAAQNLNLEELTFKLYNNSNSGSNYAARDVGLYVRIGTVGGFTQFGAIDDSATGNGNQGTITFSDLFTVLSGQTVQLRLAFTDRTRGTNDLQAATRIGSIDISASAGGDATKVTTSSSAPATEIISSDPTGTTVTKLFDEDANANHARGQAFQLADGSGTGYEITAITIKKSDTQVYSNDALVLRIFEGTTAQWDAGTGHSTGTDGHNYYVDTTVTPLYTEVFTLNGTFTNNDYVTFTLSQPITVNEDSDFGFFMTYHKVGGSQDFFQHFENGNGGRLSITATAHGIASSGTIRGVHYFVHGTATGVQEYLKLASPFQDRMVLQRGKPVKVWGAALPSTAVSATFDGGTVNGTSDANGDWELELPSHLAGGPYSLVVTSGVETKTVNDVLVGDVWFCFGQSNMVYNLNSMQSWKTTYINDISANDNIRCLKITQKAATSEQNEGPMTWLDNSTAGTWSAVAAVFAHQMHQETGVPTAIIWAAWGSSSIEGWMPLSMTEQFPHFDAIMDDYYLNDEADVIAQLNGSQTYDDVYIRTRPNIIYNQMVHPMLDYGMSGFIWYQGESNAGNILNCAQYKYTLPGFVTEYRERFDQGDLPFLGVQLPSINAASRSVWHWFRESQAALENMTNGHIAVAVDTGDTGANVHPLDTGKEQIG
ncbi:MAG: sialate O-acetylesterase, partial [Opitutales bacterium]|nr:sialate O-acetylesterase [Opitutales bacterium]